MIENLSILDRQSRKFVDILYVILLLNDKYSHLPELYLIFGKNRLCDLLDIFGGTTIHIPNRRDFLRAARDAVIYFSLMNESEETWGPKLTRLSAEYNMPKKNVLKIFGSVHEYIKKAGLELVLRGKRRYKKRRTTTKTA